MPADAPTKCIWLAQPRKTRSGLTQPHLLSQQGWDVTAFDDPVLAMAELALCERAQAARSAWGLERVNRVVLAVEEPDACSQTSAMLAAVARYLPDVAVWHCSNGQLQPVTLTPASSAPAGAAEHGLDLIAPTDEPPKWQCDTQEANITRDELDMLLDLGGEDE